MAQGLGEADYREGALARIEDARRLADLQRWVGVIYLAGRAVEAVFRGLLWTASREQQVGHDLRDLLKKTRISGLLRDEDEDQIQDAVNEIAVVWQNDLRFVGDNCLLRRLERLSRTKWLDGRRILGDPLKANAGKVLESAETIMARGDLVWSRCKRSSKN